MQTEGGGKSQGSGNACLRLAEGKRLALQIAQSMRSPEGKGRAAPCLAKKRVTSVTYGAV